MQCRYCRAWNEEDERRCVRCGRRLHLPASRPTFHPEAVYYPGAEMPPLTTATAPALELVPDREPRPEAPAHAQPQASAAGGYQTSLFRDVANSVDARGGSKVIPIPTLMPVRPQSHPELDLETRAREESAQRRRSSRPKAPVRERSHRSDSQQSLDFYGAHGGQPAMGAQVEAVIYCDAPVALPAHRVIAAAYDGAVVLLASVAVMTAFAMTLWMFGIQNVIDITASSFLMFVGIVGLIALFYRFLWCMGNGDSPGMRFAGLRLVDFDGRVPDRERRGMRQIAGLLSIISAGLGLVWALVDEENLTWHDHISKTFPTAG